MRRFFYIPVIIFCCLNAIANTDVEPSYFVRVDSPDEMAISDSIFYEISRSVVFPVNKYELPSNSDFIEELNAQIEHMDTMGYRFDGIMVRGAASPEGPLRWNTFLSNRRRQLIYDLIAKDDPHGILDNCQNEEVPEDYIFLLYMMEQAGDPDYARVKEIVDRWYHSDIVRLKRELMALDGKRLWKRLLKEYYPQLRATRVVIFVTRDETKRLAPVKPADLAPPDPQMMVVVTDDLSIPPTVITPVWTPAPKRSLWPGAPRRELLSVKTNLLYDFAYMPGYDRFCPIPNVAVEYYPLHGHFTYGASFDCPWWGDYDAHKYFEVRNYQLESRYYFRSGDIRNNYPGEGAAFRGLYLQAYGQLGLYSICFDARRGWEGEAAGGGVGIGYVLPLGKSGHWRLEFGAQFGFLWTKYDPYQWECPVDPTEGDRLYYYKTTLGPSLFQRRQHHFNWLGPTRIGITISYDLLYRKNNKRGASFRPYEKGGGL